MKFVDEVKITIASGHGGPGAVSFRRESFAPRGGPDGGDGGKGGDVIFRTSRHINSLVDYRNLKTYAAQNGQPGGKANCSGPNGEDMIMIVPEGSVIRSQDGEVLYDLTGIEEVTVLKGGRGGKGNTFFKTSVNQAPEHAQPGEEGESLDIILELKLIADVGIIGFPNAGKSTLISRISAAKPKIADYPFTTLTPQLGVVKVGDYSNFVVADIPGLIKGAHQGVGLGIMFLKHIERTSLFLHLVDVSGMSGRDPLQDYEDIQFELQKYDEMNQDKDGFFPLSSREQILVLNKTDLLPKDQIEKIKQQFKKKFGVDGYAISAVTGKQTQDLLVAVADKVLKSKEEM
ncbi:GTPase ObgE [Pseudobdellovibrio exovorus]|uniref:GTPase Obg n=1 Tax=Pseudobdellovibrio exovorus JSS TaxID=1184267 RepID=M4VBH3_9BACT|nr:GTPase ObgE [Pseudobdellovibrio exovorus]AGH96747.1 GTPase ObgE [Pseudobdellovibrio exovorus JSS]